MGVWGSLRTPREGSMSDHDAEMERMPPQAQGPLGIPPVWGVSGSRGVADPEPMQARFEALAEYGMIIVGSILFGTGMLVTVVGRMVRLGEEKERAAQRRT